MLGITGAASPRKKRRGSVSTFGYDNPYDPKISEFISTTPSNRFRVTNLRRRVESTLRYTQASPQENKLSTPKTPKTPRTPRTPSRNGTVHSQKSTSSATSTRTSSAKISGKYSRVSRRRKRDGSVAGTSTDDLEDDDFLEDDDSFLDGIPMRIRIKRYLAVSNTGVFIDVLNSALSVLACILYVYELYLDGVTDSTAIKDELSVVDITLLCFFSCDYLLRCYLADNTFQYIRSLSATIDLFTILPSVLELATVNLGAYNNLKLLRILRIVRIHRMFTYIDSEVTLLFAQLALTVVSALIFTAGLLYSLEKGKDNTNQFHDELYFIVVTLSTVGYGDISPKTAEGKLVVSIFILASLIYVARIQNTLARALGEKSGYATHRIKGPRAVGHILVCGEVNAIGARDFLNEMFHEDHGANELNIVILAETVPGPELANVLKEPQFETAVTYIQGSPQSEKDLSRVAAANASACFILTDKHCHDSDMADSASILRALAVKRFVMRETGTNIMVCIQLIRPENKQHMPKPVHDGGQSPPVDPVVCIDEIKMTLLAKNLMCPGVAALIGNLVTTLGMVDTVPVNDEASLASKPGKLEMHSNGEPKMITNETGAREMETGMTNAVKPTTTEIASHGNGGGSTQESEDAKNAASNQEKPVVTMKNKLEMKSSLRNILSRQNSSVAVDDSQPTWVKEYTRGSGFEIYRCQIPPSAQGLKFSTFAALTYTELGVLVFALEIGLQTNAFPPQIYLNPGDFAIPSLEKFTVDCFVIAPNAASADLRSVASVLPDLGRGNQKRISFRGPHLTGKHKPHNYATAIARARAEQAEQDRLEKAKHDHVAVDAVLPSRDAYWRKLKRGGLPAKLRANVATGGGSEVDGAFTLYSKVEEHYHVFKYPLELHDATIKKTLKQDYPKVRSHIVITGSTCNLYYLIKTLRAKHLSAKLADLIPIVVLGMNPPSYTEWKQITRFPGVFYIKGSPLDDLDLIRSGIHYARAAVILAKPTHERSSSMETLADANAIFIHQRIKTYNKKIQIITELVNHNNIELLDLDSLRLSELRAMQGDYHYSSQYASGGVYTSSMLDTLVCQAFFNPHITNVIHKLIAGDTQELGTIDDRYKLDIRGSNLQQVAIPEEFIGEKYEKMFLTFVEKYSIVALGLLRQPGTSNPSTSSPFPYVYTNPRRSDIVQPGDAVFVLSQKLPQDLAKLQTSVLAGATAALECKQQPPPTKPAGDDKKPNPHGASKMTLGQTTYGSTHLTNDLVRCQQTILNELSKFQSQVFGDI